MTFFSLKSNFIKIGENYQFIWRNYLHCKFFSSMRCTLPQNLFNEFFKSNSVRLICSNIESFFLAAFIFKIFIRFNTHNTLLCVYSYIIFIKKNINKIKSIIIVLKKLRLFLNFKKIQAIEQLSTYIYIYFFFDPLHIQFKSTYNQNL